MPTVVEITEEKEVIPKMNMAKKTISFSTCRVYLKAWGFSFSEHKKNVYMDGHEREDVVAYRQAWVTRMKEHAHRMAFYEGEDLLEEEMPLLEEDEKRRVHLPRPRRPRKAVVEKGGATPPQERRRKESHGLWVYVPLSWRDQLQVL